MVDTEKVVKKVLDLLRENQKIILVFQSPTERASIGVRILERIVGERKVRGAALKQEIASLAHVKALTWKDDKSIEMAIKPTVDAVQKTEFGAGQGAVLVEVPGVPMPKPRSFEYKPKE